jgi:NADH dehydrogenase
LPYFHGKGVVEDILRASGLSCAIVRPSVIFGPEDLLINNIAWTLRKFPIFAIPGDGEYRLQPTFVEDLADFVVNAAEEPRNIDADVVGPEILTFNELVRLIGRSVGRAARIVHVPPPVALLCTSVIGRMIGDVMLTADELRGLTANLLVSKEPGIAPTRFSDWLARNAENVGRRYVSELAKRA